MQTAKKNIRAICGDNTLVERIVKKWFAMFRAGDFSLEDRERLVRPHSTDDDDQIEILIDYSILYAVHDIAKILKLSITTTIYNQ